MAINTVINTNMMALTAHRNLGTVGNRQNKSNQRLSSGKKINSAADDAAGLAISEKMKAQIKGLDMAAKNSEDAISLIQTAEGSLTEVNNMLTRMRELSVQAANDTNQQEDRVKIAQEVAELLSEVDAITERTEFNEKKLNDGSFKDGHFQIGANGGQNLNLSIGKMDVKGLGLDELMDTFGIEGGKEGSFLKFEVRKADGSAGTPTENAAGKQKVELEFQTNGTAIDNNKAVTATIAYRDSEGNVKNLEVKYTNAANTDYGKDLKAALEKTELADSFNITTATNKVTLESKEGGDSKFEILGVSIVQDDNAAKGANIKTNKLTKGYEAHTSYETTDIDADGATITVGGKTYTYRTTADASKNEFSDDATFRALLEKDGIVGVSSPGTADSIAFKKKDKGYMVSSSNVSDTGKDYSQALKTIDSALKNVTQQRAKLGANQNRLEYTIKNLELSSENLNAARSRIEDTDMAKEMMNLTQANVLQQAATSILAQANQAPQSITQLLG